MGINVLALIVSLVSSLAFVSALNLSFTAPSSVELNTNFSVSIQAQTQEQHDVKIIVEDNHSKIVSEIYRERWRSSFYYLTGAFPATPSFTLHITQPFTSGSLCVKLRKTGTATISQKCQAIAFLNQTPQSSAQPIQPAQQSTQNTQQPPQQPTTSSPPSSPSPPSPSPSSQPAQPTSSQNTQPQSQAQQQTQQLSPTQQSSPPSVKGEPINLSSSVQQFSLITRQQKLRIFSFYAFTLLLVILLLLLLMRKSKEGSEYIEEHEA